MVKTLKSLTAAECSSERSRHRVQIAHLVLQRMRPDTTAAEKARIDADILKRRRRIARLDRRSAIVSRPTFPTTADDAVIQPIHFGGH